MSKLSVRAGLGITALLALALLLMVYFITTELSHTDGQLGVPLDDAYIHYQFARNLSQGQGFSFNPGEPTPGSTSPLWTILLAVAGLINLPFLPVSILASAFFYLATILLTFTLSTTLSHKPLVGLAAALAVTVTGRLLWAALAGMETTAFTALSLAAVWLYARRGMQPVTALVFGLASQMRPEGHALFILAVLDTIWGEYRANRQKPGTFMFVFRGLLSPFIVYLAISLPYTLFSLSQTGRPLPNTFYAKAGTEHLFSLRTMRETAYLLWRDNQVALLLMLPGLLPTWRRSRLVVLWLVSMPLMTAVTVDFVWHHGRYSMPIIPFVMIVAVQGFDWFIGQTPTRYRSIATAIFLLLLTVAGAWQLPDWANMLGQNSREILKIDVAIGKWLAENTETDVLVAVDDIGAIGYLSERRLFDMNGLISPEMWPVIRNENQGHLKSEAAIRLLSEAGVDYLSIFPLWHWEIATNPYIVDPLVRFQSDSRTIIGEQEAVVYKTDLPYLKGFDAELPVASFGEAIELIDYRLDPPDSTNGRLRLELIWRSQTGIENSFDVFVHVLDPAGRIIAQADNKPVYGLAPTSRWLAGDVVKDPYTIEWPPEAASGTYQVNIGMYLRESGERLPAVAKRTDDNAVNLSSFTWARVTE